MKIRIALLVTAVLIAIGSTAPPADALSRKLIVTMQPGTTGLCRASADQIGIQFTYKAKVKRRNAPNPKKIYVSHKLTELTTGQVIQSTSLVLKPNRSKSRNFYNVTPQALLTAGQNFTASYKAWYKSPFNGRKVRTQASNPLSVAPADQLDPTLPACAVG